MMVLNAIDENRKPRKIMAMQASTLRILEEAKFSTPQALALGQAIDEEVGRSQTQFVTVPIFNAGIAEVRAEISGVHDGLIAEMAKLETRMTNKMLVMWVSVIGIVISMTFLRR
jgi:hypothetical protein